jgi:hypothetical protein
MLPDRTNFPALSEAVDSPVLDAASPPPQAMPSMDIDSINGPIRYLSKTSLPLVQWADGLADLAPRLTYARYAISGAKQGGRLGRPVRRDESC